MCPEAYTPAAHIETGIGLRAMHYRWGVLQHGINHYQSNQPGSVTLKAPYALHALSNVEEMLRVAAQKSEQQKVSRSKSWIHISKNMSVWHIAVD